MSLHKEDLVMLDKDVSIYNKELIDYVPEYARVGGYIIVVNNHNNKKIWKEWKWYKREDGTMVNDKDYVIEILTHGKQF